MDQSDRRRSTVFYAADLVMAAAAFAFAQYNFFHHDLWLGIVESAGGLVYLALGAAVFLRRRFLRAASWILVLTETAFILLCFLVLRLHYTNLVFLIVPYFLAMFLLGLKSGTAVSAAFSIGVAVALAVRYSAGADALPLINRVTLGIACLFAFLFAANYEKSRADSERELLDKNREIEWMSHQDGLTGLFNRRYFDLVLAREFHRAKREHEPLALIIGDIDFFKNYNDSLGHLQGDACLIDVARAIAASITRVTDTATRFGGEEFAVLLPNTDAKGAMTVAQRIRRQLAEKALPHPQSDVSRVVTLSLGAAVLSQNEDSEPNDLVNRADRALYRSKTNGRDQTTFL